MYQLLTALSSPVPSLTTAQLRHTQAGFGTFLPHRFICASDRDKVRQPLAIRPTVQVWVRRCNDFIKVIHAFGDPQSGITCPSPNHAKIIRGRSASPSAIQGSS